MDPKTTAPNSTVIELVGAQVKSDTTYIFRRARTQRLCEYLRRELTNRSGRRCRIGRANLCMIVAGDLDLIAVGVI